MKTADKPLAHLLCPQKFEDFVGQEHIFSQSKPLWDLIHSDRFYSLIFWGPPGCGKTSLSKIIGLNSERRIHFLSAVDATVKDIRAAIQADPFSKKSNILFLDEIHRLSKNQQDVLLQAVEEGQIKLIAATTENPSFQVNKALLSRSLAFEFKPLSNHALNQLVDRSIEYFSKPFDFLNSDHRESLIRFSGGDGRKLLNLLEILLAAEKEKIEETDLLEIEKTFRLSYDQKGDKHYDFASALIKSIRASHPDAAVYYLACMLEGGEDPRFIARRLMIAASEEIGNANPHALAMASNAMVASEKIGMPEVRIILSQTVCFLASSPKSNKAYLAIDEALADVRSNPAPEIPNHLLNAPTKFMKKSTQRSQGYRYAHDDPSYKQLTYLPKNQAGKKYYQPIEVGYEQNIIRWLKENRPLMD